MSFVYSNVQKVGIFGAFDKKKLTPNLGSKENIFF